MGLTINNVRECIYNFSDVGCDNVILWRRYVVGLSASLKLQSLVR